MLQLTSHKTTKYFSNFRANFESCLSLLVPIEDLLLLVIYFSLQLSFNKYIFIHNTIAQKYSDYTKDFRIATLPFDLTVLVAMILREPHTQLNQKQ